MKKLLLIVLASILTISMIGLGNKAVAAASTPKQVEVLLNIVKNEVFRCEAIPGWSR